MKKTKTISWVILILNIVGCVCLIYFAIPYLMHSSVVAHPDAMLPAERWDAAGMALTLGFVPLVTANVLGFLFASFGTKKRRILFFIPALADLFLVISYFIISLS